MVTVELILSYIHLEIAESQVYDIIFKQFYKLQ